MSTGVLLLQLTILFIGDILLFQPIILNVPQERERVLVPERGRERERERDENDDISYYRSSTHTARHLHSF